MKNARVLLVDPPINKITIGAGMVSLNEPLALEVLASVLHDFEVKILDMRIDPDLSTVLKDFNPDIVGITCFTTSVYTVKDIIKTVKLFDDKILTVVGGHHPTLVPEDFNDEFTDIIVLGEGQFTFRELLESHINHGNHKKIKGLAIPENGRLFYTGERNLISNLDDSPLPDRKLTKKYRDKYFRGNWRPVASIMTSRGCPFRCNFCSVWKEERGKYRVHSPERVVEELSNIDEKYVSISDDNFFHDINRAEEVYKLIKSKGIKKIYKLIGRSDTIVKKPDLVEKWAEIGMKSVIIGFESFRDEELVSINKHCSVNQNNEAINILIKNNITVSGHFIVNPNYSEEDFKALGDYVEEMKIDEPVFCILTPLPGTVLYEEKKNILTTNNYELFDLIHAVLPTRLSINDFYRQYAELYKRFYVRNKQDNPGRSFVTAEVIDKIWFDGN